MALVAFVGGRAAVGCGAGGVGGCDGHLGGGAGGGVAARYLAEQVAVAVNRLATENVDGDILVFLPGAAEIRRAQSACAAITDRHDLIITPLHGDLSAEEQDRAVKPAAKRKVILSTNVAESSVTIDEGGDEIALFLVQCNGPTEPKLVALKDDLLFALVHGCDLGRSLWPFDGFLREINS